MRFYLCILATFACLPSTADPLFSVRLLSPLTTGSLRPGAVFETVVISPAITSSGILIPAGSLVRGRVLHARSVGLGFRRERAQLDLDFFEYQLPDGTVVPCTAQVRDVDNSRESVSPTGVIRGVLAAGGPPGFARGIWRMPATAVLHRPSTRLTGIGTGIFTRSGFGPPCTTGLIALRWIAFRFPDPEIHYPAGTELTLTLTSTADPAPFVDSIDEAAGEWENLGTFPREIRRSNQKTADDIINVSFRGSLKQLHDAFTSAGWTTADPINRRTFVKMYKAWVGMKGYANAPVSKLYYEGREPDVVFQKSLNTVARRHHIRLWRLPNSDNLWLGAATHDTGVTFDFGPQMLTHRIDPAVDKERTKIWNDLAFAGCIKSAAYASVPSLTNLSRAIETDGRVLHLNIGTCITRWPTTVASLRRGKWYRCLARRFSLETRHYILRDNAFYWTFRAVRAAQIQLTRRGKLP
ncbi:MAG: LssY C-terminal domain-containing protein, partial [Bryobacteraceae bacterium]|nr:LssY C-terminal domain-containing protein [Bryobacteraceae bacterium]